MIRVNDTSGARSTTLAARPGSNYFCDRTSKEIPCGAADRMRRTHREFGLGFVGGQFGDVEFQVGDVGVAEDGGEGGGAVGVSGLCVGDHGAEHLLDRVGGGVGGVRGFELVGAAGHVVEAEAAVGLDFGEHVEAGGGVA